MSERAARAAFQPILDVVNKASGAVAPVPKGAATLNSLIIEWREQVAKDLKPSTQKATESHLRCHIIPSLGDCVYSELSAKRLQGFVTVLSNGTRTRKTIENVLLTLSSILSTARTWGYDIPKVSLSDLSLPQDTPHEVHCFTLDEMRRIARTADEPLSTICFVLSATGMRIGEVLALRQQDLDFQHRLVKIRGSVYGGEIGTPKSKASAADFDAHCLEDLALKLFGFRSLQGKRPRTAVRKPPRTPIFSEQVEGEKLQPLLAELGIKRAGFHSFRHAVASELLDAGAPISVVQAQMRHSDPRITLGIYGHVVPQSQRDAVERLAARIESQLLTDAGIADSAA